LPGRMTSAPTGLVDGYGGTAEKSDCRRRNPWLRIGLGV
jgi:hypothetical protein